MESISVVGTGYVGLVTAVCLATKGFNVITSTHNAKNADLINRGIPPFFEAGMEDMLTDVIRKGNLRCITEVANVIEGSAISFITVGTPSKPDGEIDLTFIMETSKEIGRALAQKDDYHLVVVKSTVIPGTTSNIVKPILEKHSTKKAGHDFGLCMNPEFLREGSAIYDTLYPDRIVIGGIDERSILTLESLFKKFYGDESIPILRTNPSTAEAIKYASNSFLAARVSLINEIANICEKTPEVDVAVVAKGVGMDKRIGPHFLRAGLGFGGSCFPKDVKAITKYAETQGYNPILLKAVLKVNEYQPRHAVELAKKALTTLKGRRISILGLSFKPETDDMREAPSIRLINQLLAEEASIVAYDPKAIDNTKKVFGKKISYAESAHTCIKDSECCILVTEWDEFRSLSPPDFIKYMKHPILIDGRRLYDPELFSKEMTYLSIGLGSP